MVGGVIEGDVVVGLGLAERELLGFNLHGLFNMQLQTE